jgi:hypothetical protein
MPKIITFSNLLPTEKAYPVAGFNSVNSFRVFRYRNPDALKAHKIGHYDFFERADLELLKQVREMK